MLDQSAIKAQWWHFALIYNFNLEEFWASAGKKKQKQKTLSVAAWYWFKLYAMVDIYTSFLVMRWLSWKCDLMCKKLPSHIDAFAVECQKSVYEL